MLKSYADLDEEGQEVEEIDQNDSKKHKIKDR